MVNKNNTDTESIDSVTYNVNIKIITFSAIVIALILIIIYCIKVYAAKKQSVLRTMVSETYSLERVLYNDLNYSKYFVNLMANQIYDHHEDKNFIKKTLHEYIKSSNFNTLFGWRQYSWVDSNFKEVTTSYKNEDLIQKELLFIQEFIKHSNWKDRTIFYNYKGPDQENNNLMLIKSLSDKEANTYIGSIILTYDIAVLTRRINVRRKNDYTNFVILDNKMEVITSSKPIIENIIDEKEELSPLIAKVLKKVDFFNNFSKEVSFLDMISGINYYIKKVDGLPFIIIISLDNKEIQHEILEGAIRKFWEVGTAALIFIILVFAIYKRETSLRARAERATIIANKATKAKSDFLAFTAHEIRSPLGFILTGSEMLTKGYFGKMPEECNNYVGGIHKNAKLILDFITDILDENQIIEGKFKITNAIENVEGIIHQAISINKLRFNDRKINIICQLEPKLPELICDRRRILQVISNLISNAIKYSNDGTTVTVVAKVAHDNMEIEVIDQGIGMSSDDIKVALSIYGMVTRNSHFIDSYGLGLPIVKMLVDIHDGKLSIKSDPNVGTNVKISFPKYKLIYQVKKEDSNG